MTRRIEDIRRLPFWGALLLTAGVATFAYAMAFDHERGLLNSAAYPLALLAVYVGIFCLSAHYLKKDQP